MTSLSTTLSRVAAASGVIAFTAVAGTTAASASTPGPARAPYAQASALVGADGSVFQAKGIQSVTKPQTGVYCIKFTDPRLDPQKLTPVATLGATGSTPWDAQVLIRTDPSTQCGNATDTVTVYTGTSAGFMDLPFYFLVP